MGYVISQDLKKVAPWVAAGEKYIGLKEIPGPKHNMVILGWLDKLGASWRDDETPWCGVFAAACMFESKLPYPKLYMRALSWNGFGTKLSAPAPGCVVTFTRKGGGHVGFVVGMSTDGKLLVLGGNQGDAVSIAKFDLSRNPEYWWPNGVPLPALKLEVAAVAGASSTNEA